MSTGTERFSVRVAKDHLPFCSAHFISYHGQCEALHGHNYRATVEVRAPLCPTDRFVFDFVALRQRAKEITDALDHRVLLPTRSPVIRVAEVGPAVRATYQDREWVFPRGDCALLPIENTTAELLARFIGERLREALRDRHGFTPAELTVEVEEAVCVSAVYEWRAE